MLEGKGSSKYQLTLPAVTKFSPQRRARRALRIQPGDAVRYEVEGRSVRVSIVRPDIGDVLDGVLDEFDFAPLQEVTQGDAVRYMKRQREPDD